MFQCEVFALTLTLRLSPLRIFALFASLPLYLPICSLFDTLGNGSHAAAHGSVHQVRLRRRDRTVYTVRCAACAACGVVWRGVAWCCMWMWLLEASCSGERCMELTSFLSFLFFLSFLYFLLPLLPLLLPQVPNIVRLVRVQRGRGRVCRRAHRRRQGACREAHGHDSQRYQ